METFLEVGSGRRRRGVEAALLGRLQESLTMTLQLTETEQVMTRAPPTVTWPPEVRSIWGGGTYLAGGISVSVYLVNILLAVH